MNKNFLVYLLVCCTYLTSVAVGQQQDTAHTHSHSSRVHMHDTIHEHDHEHDHGQAHNHNHEHVHVHNHGSKHTHDEITFSAFGTQATHNASFNSLPPVENCCTGFTDSKGIGFGVELGFTTLLSDDGLALTPHVAYQHMPVSFESFSTEKAFTGGVVSGEALFRHTLDVAWSTLTFGARLEYPLFQGFYLGAGLDANYFATGSFNQTETLEEPSNLVFENGSRIRLDKNGYVRGYNSTVLYASGSVRIRLIEKQIGKLGLDLFGRYSLPLQPLFSAQTWRGRNGNPPSTFFIDSYSVSLLSVGLGFAL